MTLTQLHSLLFTLSTYNSDDGSGPSDSGPGIGSETGGGEAGGGEAGGGETGGGSRLVDQPRIEV